MNKCICGQSESKVVFPVIHKFDGKKNILKCTVCGQFRTDPFPMMEQKQAEELYDVPDYFLGAEINPDFWMKMQDKIIQSIKKFKSSGTFLDVGCGMGFLPEAARREGFNAIGIDLNPHAVAKGKKLFPQLNIEVRQLETIEDNSVDVVVISHVLEHVVDPGQFLNLLKSKLKEDGLLVIGVPNIKGGVPRFLRALNHIPLIPGSNWLWYGYQLDQHLWHFTPELVQNLLTKNGWQVKLLKQNTNMHYGAVELPQFRYRVLRRIWSAFEKMNCGDNIIVLAGKK